MKTERNQRGFVGGKFEDRYGESCSIQKSSLATEDCIWLGIDNPKLVVFEDESHGRYIETKMPAQFSVNARMHLTREQVVELLPYLQAFAETGDLPLNKEQQ